MFPLLLFSINMMLSDFDELLCEASESGAPFHSKFHALAYMLAQSPRPMVKTHVQSL